MTNRGQAEQGEKVQQRSQLARAPVASVFATKALSEKSHDRH